MKALNLHIVLAGLAVSTAMALVSPNAVAAEAKKVKKPVAVSEEGNVPTAVLENEPKEKAAVQNAKNREDIDNEITNAKLRASTGAKSLFSFQSALNYNGGSVKDPLSPTRPKLSPGALNVDPTKLSASVSGKYRITDHDNLNVGFGLGWLTPFRDGQKGQAEDPYIAYGRVFKKWGLQNVFNVLGTYQTTTSARASRDFAESDIDHTILWAFPSSKWQLGLNVAWTHEFYSEEAPTGASADDPGARLVDIFSAYPFAEYAFSDTYSFRTVYRGLSFYNTKGAMSTFTRDTETQSLGLGIAVTRDIYLYPNLQWVWRDIRADRTDVAISANINL